MPKKAAMRRGKPPAPGQGKRRRHGPQLSKAMRRELDAMGPGPTRGSDDEEGSDAVAEDVYEYEEGVPEEESGKNGRYDAVAKYEYNFDSDASDADEDVPSEEGEDMEEDDNDDGDDEDKQIRILQETTGMPREAFGGKKRKQPLELPLQHGDGDGPVTIHDLLDNVQGKPGYSKIRKRLQQQEKKRMVVLAPLPKVERDKIERNVTFQKSKNELTKWEGIVKTNREAPVLYFENDTNLGVNTVAAIASEFKPRTEFEKRIAEITQSTDIIEAHKNDGAKILELNKDISRMLKKDKLKAASADFEADPEAVKDHARKQEFKRAEERMTLKHKNTSQWAKRIIKRGLSVQDEGTRAAIAAQLQQNTLLTRKMNSMKDDSSSEESSDDDEDESDSEAKILNRGKEKILKALEEDNEIPNSAVFSLPFMERAMKKREEATYEEARQALEEYDDSLKKLEENNTEQNEDSIKVSGKRTFGPVKNTHEEFKKRRKLHDTENSSDSEYDSEPAQHLSNNEVTMKHDDIQLGNALLDDEPQNDIYKSFNDIIKNPRPKTTFEVGMLAGDSWKKVKSNKGNGQSNGNGITNKSKLPVPSIVDPKPKQQDHKSDSDSEEEMVEGFLTVSDRKENYELPLQADLIRQAFAGDDVEAEFEKDKMDVLNEENPEPEKPALVPGWGQWTDIQQKKGLPSWMIKEHEVAKRNRQEALKRRKDSKLKHVIISEHVDKKVEKYLARNLPFPFTSKDAYEQSIRMPIGPDFNPVISVSALNRPAIVKKPGVIIKPIQYEEVNPHEKPDEPKRVIQRATPNRNAKKAFAKQGKGATSQKRK
ncbi:unnamed protein product [Miscanthus lutarioriparius]|uniref:Uncharacterized protein n=1 Tax=Miscanthus lutarioriparius TaxID=422564 RepID=A0A811SM82_9POAL|nr:unnamed protein product [Miscanthus lutarioriparius]